MKWADLLNMDIPQDLYDQLMVQKDACQNILDAIEEAFVKERSDLLSKNKAEIEALFEERRHMEETEFLEARQERERRFQARIDELRQNDADEYNKNMIAFER